MQDVMDIKEFTEVQEGPDPNMSLLGFSNSDQSDHPVMGCPALYSRGYKFSNSSGVFYLMRLLENEKI